MRDIKDIKLITHDTIPCWYELAWKPNQKGEFQMVLRIHTDFINNESPIPPESPIVENFKKSFNFKEFSHVFGKDMGFENILHYLGETDGFLEYLIQTPLCRKVANNRCMSCNGTGTDQVLEGKCIFCENGMEIFYDYKEAFAVSASLSVLFMLMYLPEKETSAPMAQLLTVQTNTARELYNPDAYLKRKTAIRSS